MTRIKLLDYQLNDIRNRLDATYNKVEDRLLDKYQVCAIDYLNATDYDDIMNDIMDFTCEIRLERKSLGLEK